MESTDAASAPVCKRLTGNYTPGRFAASGKPPCAHCKRRAGDRARRLCTGCYKDPLVRCLYPLQPRHSRFPEPKVPKKGPKEATSHPPGSVGKIKVMAERFTAGERLWHEDDARRSEA